MMITLKNILLLFFVALVGIGCARIGEPIKPLVYSSQMEYGFQAQSSEIFENPPLGKTRIYVFREKKFAGAAISYDMSIDYNPIIKANAKIDKNTPKEFLFHSRNGFAYYVDIVPTGNPVAIHSATEAQYNFFFTPKPNLIYCIESSVGFGYFIGRPYYTLVEKNYCSYHLSTLFKPENLSQWLKDKERFESK